MSILGSSLLASLIATYMQVGVKSTKCVVSGLPVVNSARTKKASTFKTSTGCLEIKTSILTPGRASCNLSALTRNASMVSSSWESEKSLGNPGKQSAEQNCNSTAVVCPENVLEQLLESPDLCACQTTKSSCTDR